MGLWGEGVVWGGVLRSKGVLRGAWSCRDACLKHLPSTLDVMPNFPSSSMNCALTLNKLVHLDINCFN